MRKLVLVAIVLIIGLGFAGCSTKKASVINGPQDIETSVDRAVQPKQGDFVPFAYEVSESFIDDALVFCYWPADSFNILTATVSGNNIVISHRHIEPLHNCHYDVVGADLDPTGIPDKRLEFQEYQYSSDSIEAGCANLMSMTIVVHNVPSGLYTISVRRPYGWREQGEVVGTPLEVAVGVVSTNQPADI